MLSKANKSILEYTLDLPRTDDYYNVSYRDIWPFIFFKGTLDIQQTNCNSNFSNDQTLKFYNNSQNIFNLVFKPQKTLQDLTQQTISQTTTINKVTGTNTITSSPTFYPVMTLYFKNTIEWFDNLKKVKVMSVYTIWSKVNAYLFGMLPDGTRWDGN